MLEYKVNKPNVVVTKFNKSSIIEMRGTPHPQSAAADAAERQEDGTLHRIRFRSQTLLGIIARRLPHPRPAQSLCRRAETLLSVPRDGTTVPNPVRSPPPLPPLPSAPGSKVSDERAAALNLPRCPARRCQPRSGPSSDLRKTGIESRDSPPLGEALSEGWSGGTAPCVTTSGF
jgi:hypothetical protein